MQLAQTGQRAKHGEPDWMGDTSTRTNSSDWMTDEMYS
jgi:hypothetical protein